MPLSRGCIDQPRAGDDAIGTSLALANFARHLRALSQQQIPFSSLVHTFTPHNRSHHSQSHRFEFPPQFLTMRICAWPRMRERLRLISKTCAIPKYSSPISVAPSALAAARAAAASDLAGRGCASHIRRRQKQLPIGADSFLAAAGTGSHHRTAPSAASGSMHMQRRGRRFLSVASPPPTT